MRFDRITLDHLSPIDEVLLSELIKHIHYDVVIYDSSIKKLSKYFDVSEARMENLINEGIKLDILKFRVLRCKGIAIQQVMLGEEGGVFIEELRDLLLNNCIRDN
jgi:hypothetical protein